MKDLKVGEKVLTASANGIFFSDVYFFGHRDSTQILEYVNIITKTTKIQMSGEHYLEVYRDTNVIVRASRVKIGDEITVFTDRLHREPVIEIYTSKESGMYNPYTLDGNIIVDNVLASCYSESDAVPVESVLRNFIVSEELIDSLSPSIYHRLFAVFRALYEANGVEWIQRYALENGEQNGYKDLSLIKLITTAITT